MSRPRVDLGYIVSLPERTLRAVAAGLGGMLYEATQVLMPGWLRRSRIYRATVANALRIVIEVVGGTTGILPVLAENAYPFECASLRRYYPFGLSGSTGEILDG
jgi:hypothetical protein